MSLLKTLWILPFVFGMNSKLTLKVQNDSTLLLWPCFFHTTLSLASHVPSPWTYFGSWGHTWVLNTAQLFPLLMCSFPSSLHDWLLTI